MKIIIARETEINLGIRRNSVFGKETRMLQSVLEHASCSATHNTFTNYPQFCFAKFVNINILKEHFEFFCEQLCVLSTVIYLHMYVSRQKGP